MSDLIVSQVFNTLMNIYNLNIVNPCKNERYLHHFFTKKIQKVCPIVYTDLDMCKLHPEWATSNQLRNGGKYKKSGNKYVIDENGTSGFIDFALGNYKNPEIGIEFKSIESWQSQSIVFDYMKLLDGNNHLKKAVSVSIIYRKNKLSNRLTLSKINETITELKGRLESRLDTNRPFLFWIIEIDYNNNKRMSWYCKNLNDSFNKGVPQQFYL